MPIPEHAQGHRRLAERHAVGHLLSALGYSIDNLTHTPDGAPCLPGCFISISHSRAIAVVAINHSRPIGIDAEEYRPTLQRVKSKFLSEAESQWAGPTELLRLWTVKEAVYKRAGQRGLAFTAIDTHPTWAKACAGGNTYVITFLQLGDTMLCLSI